LIEENRSHQGDDQLTKDNKENGYVHAKLDIRINPAKRQRQEEPNVPSVGASHIPSPISGTERYSMKSSGGTQTHKTGGDDARYADTEATSKPHVHAFERHWRGFTRSRIETLLPNKVSNCIITGGRGGHENVSSSI
jgi:hypothetical protein